MIESPGTITATDEATLENFFESPQTRFNRDIEATIGKYLDGPGREHKANLALLSATLEVATEKRLKDRLTLKIENIMKALIIVSARKLREREAVFA